MVRKDNTSIKKVGGFLLGFGGLLAASSPALAVDLDYGQGDAFSIKYSGYARATVGVLLEDHDETSADDKWRMNQARATVNLDFDIKTGPLNWKLITRFEHEHQTDYLDDLEDAMNAVAATGLQGNYGKHGKKGDFMEQYETTDEVMDIVRELYFDWAVTDRLFVRVGRQQLVWGESDFFQAMDVVHGYDYRQRLFYENNEEWRKPLFLFNFNLDLYELGGSLNWFIRPGWDRAEDMGSNYNIEGGRWIPHPYRGVDFTQFTDAYDEGHRSGDWDDMTYGIRWNGTWGSVGYSFAYLKTFNAAPVINPNLGLSDPDLQAAFHFDSSQPFVSYGGEAADSGKLLGDWIYPEIDVYGFTMNYFSMDLDATLSAEIAYVPNKPFNYGQLQSDLPGWQGIREKDVLNIMLRVDKEFKWMDVLGTHRPSLSSLQLFDTWILGYDEDDEIVEFASFGSKKKEHTVYLTLFTLLNYTRDTINPSFVIGTDLSNGGGFAIPAVEFVWGDDWRLKIEADLWWSDGDEKKTCQVGSACNAAGNGDAFGLLGKRETSASFMDWFADDNQLVFKLTRQF